VTVRFTATLLICLLGLVLIFKGLPPNRWFGVRTARTASDSAAWYQAHRAFGWIFLITGAVAGVLGLWPTTPIHPAAHLIGVLLVAAATVFVYRRYAA
jgi:uncharacterized membrane protein